MSDYLLAGKQELERLQLQARAWAPETEALLECIGVQPGWTAVDLGCGAMGVLGALSRRVGPSGRVIGLDQDTTLLAAARAYISEQLANVELLEGDILQSGLPSGAFDIVHERFVMPHVAAPEKLLQEMWNLAKPGGVVILQEPDHNSWQFHPTCASWPRLLSILEAVLGLRGDINIGRRTYQLMRQAGFENVQMRAGVLGLTDRHPYMKMPLVGLSAMRDRILTSGISSAAELDCLAAEVGQCCDDPERIMISFTTTQVWGMKPR